MNTHALSVVRRFYAFQFLSGMHFFSAVLVPLYTDWGGVGIATGLLLQSWFTFWIFVLEVPTGVVADRFGRKYSLYLGCLILSLATLVYGSYPHLAVFAAGEFLFATGVALISGADKALLYDHLLSAGVQDQANKYWGRARSAHLMGILIAAPIGSLMAQALGIPAPMLLTSLPLLAAAWLIRGIPEPPTSSDKKNGQSFITLAVEGVKILRTHKELARWTINSTIVATAGYFVIWQYQPLMAQLNLPLAYYGLAHTLLGLSEVAVSATYSRVEKMVGSPNRLFAISALATSASILAAAAFPSLPTLIILLVVGGSLGLTRAEFMTVAMNQHIDSANRATVNSAISMYRRLVLAVLNPGFGLATQTSLPLSLTLTGLLPLLTLLFPL